MDTHRRVKYLFSCLVLTILVGLTLCQDNYVEDNEINVNARGNAGNAARNVLRENGDLKQNPGPNDDDLNVGNNYPKQGRPLGMQRDVNDGTLHQPPMADLHQADANFQPRQEQVLLQNNQQDHFAQPPVHMQPEMNPNRAEMPQRAPTGGRGDTAGRAPRRPIKIAESPECAADVRHMCSAGTMNNNFAVLDCLATDKPTDEGISTECQHYIWGYKRNLTMDVRFDSAAFEVCRTDLSLLTECNELERGKGLVISCLMENKENMTQANCKQFLTRMASIVFSDYRLINKFTDACGKDIDKHHCGRMDDSQAFHTQGATIECLSSEVRKLEDQCKHQILRIAELQSDDFHLDRPLFYACRDDRENFCAKTKAGGGKVFKCLYRHKFERTMSSSCREKLVARQKLMRENYRVNHGLAEACHIDIKKYHCLRDHREGDNKRTKHGRMSQVLLCLEGAQKDNLPVTGECASELIEMRRSLLEDYKISPNLVLGCDQEIKEHCGGGIQRGGETIHCLLGLAQPEARDAHGVRKQVQRLGHQCLVQLKELVREADPGQDIRLDPVLIDACSSVMTQHCADVGRGEGNVINCLMQHLTSKHMDDECKGRLVEIQYFIVRDFRLDPQLYQHCRADAVRLCNAPDQWYSEQEEQQMEEEESMNRLGQGDEDQSYDVEADDFSIQLPQHKLVFTCLYQRNRYHSSDPDQQLSRQCAFEITRAMKVRAANINLDPMLEEPCMEDTLNFCAEKIGTGEELGCLQDNYDYLTSVCRDVVGNFTMDMDHMPELDRILMQSCTPMIERFCQEAEDEELMDCLIVNKNNKDMNPKCQAGINHHQLISLHDYKFTYKFKEACKDDVSHFCPHKKRKNEIVKCLSEHMRNDTLLESKHRINRKCRRQLRYELLQRSENIDLDPDLKLDCEYDISMYCGDVPHGKGAVIECLRQHVDQLNDGCKNRLFKREAVAVKLDSADYMITTACKTMIKRHCDAGTQNIVACLKPYLRDVEFDPVCKSVLKTQEIMKSKDYNLNPLLAKACHYDIEKFCEQEKQAKERDNHYEGNVINCLKIQFPKKRLSHECEDHIRDKIQDAALDYRQDAHLVKMCAEEINQMCSEDHAVREGQVEECLKTALTQGKIQNTHCQKEVIRIITENRADIQVDPLLHRACAKALNHLCYDVPQGEGRQMSCLLSALQDKTVKLPTDCKKMLNDRVTMWEYAAKVAPPDTFEELYVQVTMSKSRNYFLSVLFAFTCILFMCGIVCGRSLKRVTAVHKNK